MFTCFVKKPSSMLFAFLKLLKLCPSVTLPCVLQSISIIKLFTSNNRCLSYLIFSLKISTIQTSHLMPIKAFMLLMLIFHITNSSTTRAFLDTDYHLNSIDIFNLIFFSHFVHFVDFQIYSFSCFWSQ